MSLVAGVDWSSQAIDCALIPLEDAAVAKWIAQGRVGGISVPTRPTFRREDLVGKHHERIQSVFVAMSWLLRPVGSAPVVYCVIEEAFGQHRNVDRVLLPIFGAIVAACGQLQIPTESYSAKEWRSMVGVSNGKTKKEDAIRLATEMGAFDEVSEVTDHKAEAFLLAHAGREFALRNWSEHAV